VSTSVDNEVKNEIPICFNHALLVLDSTTFAAVVNSKFINQFAFSYEKKLQGYQGFYLIGSTNYIELFHPKSMKDEDLKIGDIWICLASLKANYLKTLNTKKHNFIKYESDEQYNYLSLMINDSINPITTWEMRKIQYESWTKKEYHDSIVFLPVDYNSPQESDSSSNYLMNDVIGIGLSLNPDDSSKVISYFKTIGYDSVSEYDGHVRISNKAQFIELHISDNTNSQSINRFYIQLNKSVDKSVEIIGNSRIEYYGNQAIWIFE
jgi:hypothetical protein